MIITINDIPNYSSKRYGVPWCKIVNHMGEIEDIEPLRPNKHTMGVHIKKDTVAIIYGQKDYRGDNSWYKIACLNGDGSYEIVSKGTILETFKSVMNHH